MTIERLKTMPHRLKALELDEHLEYELERDLDWILGVEDVLISRILSCRYARGMNWYRIGHEIGIPGDSCRMMVYRYLKKMGVYR